MRILMRTLRGCADAATALLPPWPTVFWGGLRGGVAINLRGSRLPDSGGVGGEQAVDGQRAERQERLFNFPLKFFARAERWRDRWWHTGALIVERSRGVTGGIRPSFVRVEAFGLCRRHVERGQALCRCCTRSRCRCAVTSARRRQRD